MKGTCPGVDFCMFAELRRIQRSLTELYTAPMSPAQRMVSKARAAAKSLLGDEVVDNCGADRGTQLSLALGWAQNPDLPLRDVEFRNNSQNGEDGILLYLFTVAGHGSRRAVEICAGNGIENNIANLVLHHDWDALMLDGDADSIATGVDYYARHPETSRIGPTLAAEWITAENVNDIVAEHGYSDDVDLLSLDMDGVDYWILKSLQLTPRVIVAEYNNRIPADRAVTVPYAPDFTAAGGAWTGDGFFGASLLAFDKLLGKRVYRLVGANRPNTNAVFLRDDVLPGRARCSVESCLQSRWAKHQRASWDSIADRPWVEV